MDEIEGLRNKIEELKKINGVKSDLISVSAHQLRTSVSAVKWTLQMLLDKDIGPLSEEQEQFIKKSYGGLELMNVMVNDMLTLNSTDDEEIILKFEKVNLVELIEQTVLEFSGEAKKKGMEIIFTKSEENLPEINCNRQMTRVIFQNLIENGLKYNRPNGKIWINLKNNKNEVEITIKDSGIGIDRRDQANIFQRFFRAENAKKKDPIGSGLGLYTIKKIVSNQGGTISFESEPGEGTTFTIVLPIN